MGYLPQDHRQYEFAPIHIDGTGDTVFDPIAAIGVLYDDMYHMWAQGDAPMEDEFEGAETLNIETFEDDAGILEAFATFIEDEVNVNDTVFVGYNEEQWRGGGFGALRTRSVRNDVEWPLDRMYYTDFGEAIAGKGRFNTSVPSMSGANVTPLNDFIDFNDLDVDKSLNKTPKQNAIEAEGYTVEQVREFAEATGHEVPHDSLDGLKDVYELFVEDDLLDPIESEAAVRDLVEMGDTNALIEHTVADLTRTEELYRLADEFTSRDDWHTKQL